MIYNPYRLENWIGTLKEYKGFLWPIYFVLWWVSMDDDLWPWNGKPSQWFSS